jgi:hypothetical protein
MSKHAEVIYETGAHSVISVDSLDELKAGLAEHHRRAMTGEDGGPAGHPAERIKRVILYDYHPADFNVGGKLDAASVHELLEGMTGTDGTLDADQLNAAVRDETSPVYPVNQGRHESIYKMDGEEMDLAFLGDNGNVGTSEGA